MRKEKSIGIIAILFIFLVFIIGIFLWGNYKVKTIKSSDPQAMLFKDLQPLKQVVPSFLSTLE